MYREQITIGLHTRLGDLILIYPPLVEALYGLNIDFGFGDDTIEQIAATHKLSAPALLVICEAFIKDLDKNIYLDQKGIKDLMLFLHHSHQSFQQIYLPMLKSRMNDCLPLCANDTKALLQKFFDGYISEVLQHFEYEENTAFPYINSLLQNNQTTTNPNYNIDEFAENHTDISQKVNDLKSLLIKHLPGQSIDHKRGLFYQHLCAFERLIWYHTSLENYVLAPSVKMLEQSKRQ